MQCDLFFSNLLNSTFTWCFLFCAERKHANGAEYLAWHAAKLLFEKLLKIASSDPFLLSFPKTDIVCIFLLNLFVLSST